MLKETIWFIRILIVYVILCVACFLILRTIINYSTFQTDIQFLALKQEYLNNRIWLISFYIHSFSAVISLFAGFTQFSSELLSHLPNLHRRLGYLYIGNILFINVPAAFVMAIYANGGYGAKLAFLILDTLWFYFTYQALLQVKRRNFSSHANFMIRSYALTFSAITLRTWKIILVQSAIVPAENLYLVEVWLGFLPNLMIAEILVYYLSSLKGDT